MKRLSGPEANRGELERSREAFAARLGDVRAALARDTGLRPRKRHWWPVLIAAGVGVALAWKLGKGKRRRG